MSKPVIAILVIAVLSLVGIKVLIPEKEVVRIGQQHAIQDEGEKHLASTDEKHAPYVTDQPTSGPHFAQPAAWGVSEREIPDEQWIHNLEHGGVVITYKPDLPAKDIDELRVIAANLTMRDEQTSKKGFKVVLTPRAANKSAVQLSSWGYSISLDAVDKTKIQQFYRDRPNTAPEPNAAG